MDGGIGKHDLTADGPLPALLLFHYMTGVSDSFPTNVPTLATTENRRPPLVGTMEGLVVGLFTVMLVKEIIQLTNVICDLLAGSGDCSGFEPVTSRIRRRKREDDTEENDDDQEDEENGDDEDKDDDSENEDEEEESENGDDGDDEAEDKNSSEDGIEFGTPSEELAYARQVMGMLQAGNTKGAKEALEALAPGSLSNVAPYVVDGNDHSLACRVKAYDSWELSEAAQIAIGYELMGICPHALDGAVSLFYVNRVNTSPPTPSPPNVSFGE